MAKWFGKVGYSIPTKTAPDVWDTVDEVKEYYGDVLQNNSRWSTNPESTNDDLTLSNRISIVADQFVIQKAHYIKWIEFMDVKWKVTSVEVLHPRLILTIGGVWNG